MEGQFEDPADVIHDLLLYPTVRKAMVTDVCEDGSRVLITLVVGRRKRMATLVIGQSSPEPVMIAGAEAWVIGRRHRWERRWNRLMFLFLLAFVLGATTLLWYPWCMAIAIKEERRRRETGLTRHGRALLAALRGQLTDDRYILLERALKMYCRKLEKLDRIYTFAEARALLLRCTVLHAPGFGRYQMVWADEVLDGVGWAHNPGSVESAVVRVGRSTFIGTEATSLVACHEKLVLECDGGAELDLTRIQRQRGSA